MNTDQNCDATSPILSPSYRRLPSYLYRDSAPEAAVSPRLLVLNTRLLTQLDQNEVWYRTQDALAQLSGQSFSFDNAPIALAYSGHQFGGWSARLGDGRAHLLGQLTTAAGERIDVQLKGSGATPFSRGGDGRATLGAVLREYIVSEAMAGLHISTTGSLAVITTGESVPRTEVHPGAILVRTAKSHLRVGSFQYAAAHHGTEAVKALADFTIEEHYPALAQSETPYVDLLGKVIEGQAKLVAQWMLVGFIHGVMNTDNSSITSETIDYGPCAFMDEFNPNKVFSSIDSQGRYAWGNQGAIAQWNMARFAETMLPLYSDDEEAALALAQSQLATFVGFFSEHFYQGMAQKLGIALSADEIRPFADNTLELLTNASVDFTLFFDRLTDSHSSGSVDPLLSLFVGIDESEHASLQPSLQHWLTQWQALACFDVEQQQIMRSANPKVIARNHLVEAAIAAAEQQDDLSLFWDLVRVLANPYQLAEADSHFQTPPTREQRVTRTFCGT